MNAEAREDLRQMLLEQLDVERSEYDGAQDAEYDGAQDALRAMDPDKVMDEGYVQVANRNRAAERIKKLKNAMAELEYLHQAKETSPEETTPEELTQELALKDSNLYLLEAGANMANEGKRLCRKLRAELDREDSDAECVALEVEKMMDRLNCIMNMVLEQEGVLEI